MILRALLVFVGCLPAFSAEVPEQPIDISAKIPKTFQHHFNLIVNQVKENHRLILAKENVNTFQNALNTILQNNPKTKIIYCAEFDGWFLISTMILNKDVNLNDPENYDIVFHSGFAIRKGTREIYTFGFW